MNLESSKGQPRVAISVPVSEGSLRAITAFVREVNDLHARVVPDTDLLKWLVQIARRIPVKQSVSDSVEAVALRLALNSWPQDYRVSRAADILRIVGARFRTILTPLIGHYLWRVAFDRSAARLDLADVDIIFGMPGSSEETFRTNMDALKVFHATDAHPRMRNDVLTETYGRKRAKAELYPERLIRRIERELDLADVVLVPSAMVAAQLEERGVEENKIVVVPYAVDTDLFAPIAPVPTKYVPVRPRLLYVGQISLLKGVPTLLEAVEGLDVDLVLVGNVFDARLLVKLPTNVEFLGRLSPSQLAEEYRKASAFILPTLTDAFGLVIFEAVASGLKVITTSSCGAAEYLPEDMHTIVPPGDAKRLRTAIQGIDLSSDRERKRIAAALNTNDNNGQSGYADWRQYAESTVSTVYSRWRQSRII